VNEMGYVPPYMPTQNVEYRRRTELIMPGQPALMVDSIKSAEFHAIHHANHSPRIPTRNKEMNPTEANYRKIESELTGKGRHIDEIG
jgi:hypothetical protein